MGSGLETGYFEYFYDISRPDPTFLGIQSPGSDSLRN
jgi:hypothetical protein